MYVHNIHVRTIANEEILHDYCLLCTCVCVCGFQHNISNSQGHSDELPAEQLADDGHALQERGAGGQGSTQASPAGQLQHGARHRRYVHQHSVFKRGEIARGLPSAPQDIHHRRRRCVLQEWLKL